MRKKHILAQEFIGNTIIIIESTCKSLINMQGEIINETKNTFTIQTLKGEKKIMKNQISFIIKGQGNKIYGKNLLKRPEERLKLRTKNE